MRVVADGKVGFAAASGIEEAQIDKIAEEAVAVARIRPLDPDFKHLPDPVTRPAKNGIIDDRLLEYSEKETLAGVDTLAKTTFQHDKRIKSLEGEMEVERRLQSPTPVGYQRPAKDPTCTAASTALQSRMESRKRDPNFSFPGNSRISAKSASPRLTAQSRCWKPNR